MTSVVLFWFFGGDCIKMVETTARHSGYKHPRHPQRLNLTRHSLRCHTSTPLCSEQHLHSTLLNFYWFLSTPCRPCFSAAAGHFLNFSGSCWGASVLFMIRTPHYSTPFNLWPRGLTTSHWVSVPLVSDLHKLLTHQIFANRCFSPLSSPAYMLPESVSSTPSPWFFPDFPGLGLDIC